MTDRTTLDPQPALDVESQRFAISETDEQTPESASEEAVDELISFEPSKEDELSSDEAYFVAPDAHSEDHQVEDDEPAVLEPLVEELHSEAWHESFSRTVENFDYSSQSIEDVEETETESPSLEESLYSRPRLALTLAEASAILGKSVRAIERSIQGKWGNKLPDGWQARKVRLNGEEQWRIIPPQGFSLKRSTELEYESRRKESRLRDAEERLEHLKNQNVAPKKEPSETESEESSLSGLFGFSLEKLLQSAGRRAKDELVRAAEFVSEPATIEHPTIIIDRTDEVESLLRELAATRKELAEEQKSHLDDLRLLNQAQGSMRLLEMNASHTSTLRAELDTTRKALEAHRKEYQAFLALPWWRRLFKRLP
ncbi:MAG: hypothetical protein K2Z81_07345 [Cyanobacteria bacterium]|nr:hypothetical protein [Cyanobacteriota bacterium]